MPVRKLTLRPGVDVELTPTLNSAGMSTSQLIRFLSGLPQKYGGWQQMTSVLLTGICRGMHGWSDLNGTPYLALGTNEKLQLLSGGALYDITPVRYTSNNAPSVSTTSGSTQVTIVDSANGAAIGDWINIATHISVGGIVLFGGYQVVTTPGANDYTITAPTAATATITNGGAVASYATTLGTGVVTVTLANHGLSVGSSYTAGVSTTVGGLTISGLYVVASVLTISTFTITASASAASTASASENGGNAQIAYLLPTGYATNVALSGYGAGDYGAGDYGIAGSGTFTALLRQWSITHFGQDMIASPSGGSIYYWSPPNLSSAVVLSSTAPIYNNVVFSMEQAEILIAAGAESGGTLQPTLIRWCD
ncbi:MAG TPA: hypothetical protein PLD10_24860, partial [Rhodopila sp.]|nr:hypothetical protein [Rhodopila sp.]